MVMKNLLYLCIFLISSFLLINAGYAQISITVPDQTANKGETINIPVNTSQISTQDAVISYQFDVSFNPQVLKALGASKDGTISSSASMFLANPDNNAGKMSVGAFFTTEFTGQGVVAYLQFEVIGDPAATSQVNLNNFIFNGGTPSASVNNGTFTVNYVSIDVNTSPANLQFKFDNTTYSAPKSFKVSPNSNHSLDVPDPQTDGADKRYVWKNWNDGKSKSHSVSAPGSGSSAFTANFDTQYRLTVGTNPSGAGTVSKNPNQEWIKTGTSVSLTATANSGYNFSNWTGSKSGSNNPLSFTMNSAVSVTANFVAWPTITIKTNPSNQEVIIDGSTYTAPQSRQWKPGTQHSIGVNSPISVNGGKRYVFNSWSDGGNQSHDITVPNSDKTYTANFKTQYKLTTQVDPSGGGAISKSPDATWYDANQSVSLTANANSGFQFVDWSEDLSGSTNHHDLMMNSAKTVTANFGEEVTVTVNTNPQGLKVNVDGYEYTAPHQFNWLTNTNHDLVTDQIQNEANGSRYNWTSWSDGKTRSHTILASKGTTGYTANFTQQFYLTTSSNPAAGGQVTPGSGWYDSGENVQVKANANSNYQFINWSGGLSGNETPTTVQMSQAKTVTANFTRLRNITITSSPAGKNVDVDETNYQTPKTFQWLEGSTHTINVSQSPQSGGTGIRHVYDNWSDGGNQSHDITVPNSDKTYTANFKTQYKLTTQVDPSGGGTIGKSPDATWYDANKSVELTANAGSGFQFVDWSGDLSGLTNPQNLTMNAAKTVTANFGEEVTVTVNTNPQGLKINVDGYKYTAPHQFNWLTNTSHDLATDQIQNEANGSRYNWTSWSDGKARSHTIMASKSSTSYTASFVKQFYLTTTSNPPSGGDVTPGSGWHDSGENVQVKANANSNYQFIDWSGSLSGSNNPATVQVSQAKTVTANFTRLRNITITSSPSGKNVDVDGNSYQTPKSFQWLEGSTHALNVSQSPQSGGTGIRHVYDNWSDGGNQSHNITVPNSDKTYTANFKTQYELITQVDPSGGGSISRSPDATWYDANQPVKLTANAGSGFQFVDWSGDLSGLTNPENITLSSAKTVTANFGESANFTIKTNPANLSITVDEQNYTAPKTFTWLTKSTHTIATSSPQNQNNGSRLVWDSWDDNGAISHQITVQKSKTSYTANFKTQHQLTTSVKPSGAGSVSQDKSGEWFDEGSSVQFTAHANQGYDFANWSNGASGTENPKTIVINSALNITANFTAWPKITVTSSPSGQKVLVDNQEYTSPKVFSWQPGSKHSVNVNSPQNGGSGVRYVYKSWSDNDAQSHQISTPANAATFTANFKTRYRLTTGVNPGGSGNVSLAPSGEWFDEGTNVKLTETPDLGYDFNHWSDGASGNQNPKTITMNSTKNVIANFTAWPEITITTSPSGLKIVVDGNEFTSPKKFTWQPNSNHTLKINSPQNGNNGSRYVYVNWNDGGSQEHQITTPSSATIYKANFKTQYQLTVNVTPTGSGSIDVNPSGDWFDSGAQVNLTANASSNYGFLNWSGDYSGSSASVAITMNSSKNITANFGRLRNITIKTNPANQIIKVDNKTYSYSKTFQWIENTSHSISVDNFINVNSGKRYLWKNWSNGKSRSQNYSVPGSDQTVTAYFDTQYFLTTSVSPSSGGSVAPSSGWYKQGESVKIQANPIKDWEFKNWSEDISGSSNPAQITMNSAKSVMANFQISEVIVTVTTNPPGYEIMVDGKKYTSPRRFNWIIGYRHRIEAHESYDVNAGEQLWWEKWNDNGNRSHSITVSRNVTAYSATLRNKYFLTLNSQHGSVSGAGWYWEGSEAQIFVDSPVYDRGTTRYIFTSWSGDNSGSNKSGTIQMNSPHSATANWRTEYYLDISSNISNNTDSFQSIEAENGSIVSPCLIGSEINASNSAYTFSPQRHSGAVNLNFSIKQEGDFWIWGRVFAPSNIEDSFWLLKDNNQDTILWDIGGIYSEWKWLEVTDRAKGIETFHLTPGEHQLHVFTRERNSRLDKIVITNSKNFSPSGVAGDNNASNFLGNLFGSGWYPAGQKVNLGGDHLIQVDAVNRYTFKNWSIDYSGNQNPASVTMNGPKSVIAQWNWQHYVSIAVDPETAGDVNPPSPGGWYSHNHLLQLIATPAPDFIFTNWSGSITDTSSSIELNVNEPKQVTAHFGEPNHPPSIDSLRVSPQSVVKGSEIQVFYHFTDQDNDSEGNSIVRWLKNGSIVTELDGNRIVPGDSINIGDVWQVTVQPYDGQDYGRFYYSAPVFVLPTALRNEMTFSWAGNDTTVQLKEQSLGLTITIHKQGSQLGKITSTSNSSNIPAMLSLVNIPGSEQFYFNNTIRSYWLLYTTLQNFSIDLALNYSDSLVNQAGISDERNLNLGWSDNLGDEWFYSTNVHIDTAKNLISVQGLTHLSLWAIGQKPFSKFFPVELMSFTADLTDGNKIELNWKTASETDNLGFQIERKSSNETFQKIGFIKGNGTTNIHHDYRFLDDGKEPGEYYYRLKQINIDGTFSYSDEIRVIVTVPIVFHLSQNYPNPFNNSTKITFTIPAKYSGENVTLKIYDTVGRQVNQVQFISVSPGGLSFIWDGKDKFGRLLSSGVYFYQINLKDLSLKKKMILMK